MEIVSKTEQLVEEEIKTSAHSGNYFRVVEAIKSAQEYIKTSKTPEMFELNEPQCGVYGQFVENNKPNEKFFHDRLRKLVLETFYDGIADAAWEAYARDFVDAYRPIYAEPFNVDTGSKNEKKEKSMFGRKKELVNTILGLRGEIKGIVAAHNRTLARAIDAELANRRLRDRVAGLESDLKSMDEYNKSLIEEKREAIRVCNSEWRERLEGKRVKLREKILAANKEISFDDAECEVNYILNGIEATETGKE